jgi:hypothetical protein
MLNRFQRWRQQHFLRKHGIALRTWEHCLAQIPAVARFDKNERHRLWELASRFLHDKRINGTQGLVVTDEMRVHIAAQACLLILNLGLDYFSGWREVIVYPGTFVVEHEEHDEDGIVHEERREQEGEAWEHGPVILSWADAQPGIGGYNVILHEFAHKLDMRNGAANGMPPLHSNMSRAAWTETFTRAYDDLEWQLEHHGDSAIDPYAAESPAEFFAVASETFFEVPHELHAAYPEVYAQLKLFYRQNPLAAANLSGPR